MRNPSLRISMVVNRFPDYPEISRVDDLKKIVTRFNSGQYHFFREENTHMRLKMSVIYGLLYFHKPCVFIYFYARSHANRTTFMLL
jgi:hypothetical protein